MPEKKIDLRTLIAELKKEVVEIEASDAPQADKTRRFQAAGRKFRNALYGDQRKYKGKAGRERRISVNTYNSYLSRARKVFEELGLLHHLLGRELGRLAKRYPQHAAAIGALAGLSPKETRLAKKALEQQLREAGELARKVDRIDFAKPAAKPAIARLRSDFPIYDQALAALLGKRATEAAADLEATLDEAEPLLEDLAALKVNHEILYALQMEKSVRTSHTEKKEKALGVKKRTAVAIHYPHYIQRVTNLLAHPTQTGGAGTMYAMAPLAFALCAATGRRPIEVLFRGEFDPVLLPGGQVDPHRLAFSGQAKKRSEDPEVERIIYCLAPAPVVLAALGHLRALPQVADLGGSMGVENDTRSLNAMIASRVGSPLNTYAKEFFEDQKRTLKDTRAIYARISYELWFKRDPRWRKTDEDVFFAELLGHDDETTQMHYKQFKVHDCDPDFTPETEQRSGRLARLAEYDGLMAELANGDAAEKLHAAVKAQLQQDPATKFTQSLISKLTGAYRPLIQRYMELCAEALGIEKQDNGRWRQLDEAEPAVLIEVAVPEADEAAPAEAPAPVPAAKPRIHWAREGDLWRAAVLVDGAEVAHSLDADRNTAGQEAWADYMAAAD